MDTRKIAKEYRLATWAQLVQERAELGLNVREFCELKGIHENTYYHWQRKQREVSAQELLPITQEPQQLAAPSGWSAVELTAAEPNPAQTLPIEIGSCRVMASPDTEPELLAKVCKVLVELC